MILPKELNSKPTIDITIVIDGNDSQVFFSFDKTLQVNSELEAEEFLKTNRIKALTDEFLQVFKTFIRKVD